MGELDLAAVSRLTELQRALHDVMTPRRMKALVAALYKSAVQKDSVPAARFLIERLLGKPRVEPLTSLALDIPDGLQEAKDVRVAANALLQGILEGRLSPEDAQKAAAVVETARRSIETEDLEQRLAEIEDHVKRERHR
jgi:hypothetical protein